MPTATITRASVSKVEASPKLTMRDGGRCRDQSPRRGLGSMRYKDAPDLWIEGATAERRAGSVG